MGSHRVQWFMPLIPATWEVEIRGSQFEASLGKAICQEQDGHGDTCL
jgi:hypothetical protein